MCGGVQRSSVLERGKGRAIGISVVVKKFVAQFRDEMSVEVRFKGIYSMRMLSKKNTFETRLPMM